MWKKCAHNNEEVHQIRESTAVDSGNSDTRSIQVVFKGTIRIVSVALRAMILAQCVG